MKNVTLKNPVKALGIVLALLLFSSCDDEIIAPSGIDVVTNNGIDRVGSGILPKTNGIDRVGSGIIPTANGIDRVGSGVAHQDDPTSPVPQN